MARAPVILFDGDCGLCDRWIRFVLARDKKSVFRVAPLRSEVGLELLRTEPLESVVFVDGDRVYLKSDAALAILRRLGWFWRLLAWFGSLFPKTFRDAVYDFVARHRYQWFGKSQMCQLPDRMDRTPS